MNMGGNMGNIGGMGNMGGNMGMGMNMSMGMGMMMMHHRAAVAVQFGAYIDADHSLFLQTVAGLASIPLKQEDMDRLKEYQNLFNRLENEAAMIIDTMHGRQTMMPGPDMMAMASDLVRRFLELDERWTAYIETLRPFAPTNMVWQEMISHMQREQRHMAQNIRAYMMMQQSGR